MFPRYQRHVHIDGRKMAITVDVNAETRCGPRITAMHTVRIRTLKEAETRSATILATSFAVSKLVKAHTAVEKECQGRGKHNH